ncbi:neurexin-3-beta [Willisornis vidua]|uniref:Neurexin-3-beta n=1 Tax=Willisornis vidua TaxID=1566151 RepID=A0ABQ9CYX8_9PASS|nr:neurexin-3-beta [Willisornis vidua]
MLLRWGNFVLCAGTLQPTTDDIVSSAECSSDDEDFIDCEPSTDDLSFLMISCKFCVGLSHSWQMSKHKLPIQVHDLLMLGGPDIKNINIKRDNHCPRPAGHAIADPGQDAIGLLGHLGTLLADVHPVVEQHPSSRELLLEISSRGGELVIPLLVEDPLDIPPIATRAPFITLPPTFRPLLTIIETTKDSLSMTSEAGLPCLSDQGSDGCDDDGLVISGYGSGETFDSNLPPTDDEDFYTTFSLVTDKSLSTSIFEGGYKAHAPKWESKDFRPNKVSETGRTTTTSLSPELIRSTASSSTGMVPKLPAGKMNNRELKPQPDIVLLPLPTAYELDSTKLKSPLITSPMFRNVPTANPTEPGIRRVPGASEVVRESSSTTGMVVGIVAAAALCILILLYAMYKYRNRDEGSYQVDETRNYISNSAQSNGTLVKEKQQSSKSGHKKQKNKDKEYYV